MSTRRAVAAGLALAISFTVVGVDIAWWNSVRNSRQEASAEREAIQAAQKLVPVLLSYGYTTLDRDLEKARETTTGSFRADYEKLIKTVVEPTASRRHVATSAVVAAAGVVSSSPNRVTVLLFVTQSSTSSIKKGPVATGSRIKVTLTRTGGRWLIAGLDPV